MNMCKRIFSRLTCLLILAALAGSLLPIEASARLIDFKDPLLCVAVDSNGELLSASVGIPVKSEGTQFLITSGDLYVGQDAVYGLMTENDAVTMQYVKTISDFGFFIFSTEDDVCFGATRASVGETYTLLALNTEGETVSHYLTITGFREDDGGLYRLSAELEGDIGECLFPAAVVNTIGQLTAVVSSSGKIYAFQEPATEGSDSSEPEDTPTAATEGSGDEPQPNAPSRAVPTEDSGETEAGIGETEDGAESTESKIKSSDDKDGKEQNPVILYAVAAVLLAAAAIVFVWMKAKKKSNSSGQEQPDYPIPEPQEEMLTAPVDGDATHPAYQTGWERIPAEEAPETFSIYLVATGGALNGLSYRIPDSGLLIGRAVEASVRYPADAKGISRSHCRIFWNEGALMIMDLGSTSGTFLRGKGQLQPNVPTALVEGDVIYLGSKQNALSIQVKES